MKINRFLTMIAIAGVAAGFVAVRPALGQKKAGGRPTTAPPVGPARNYKLPPVAEKTLPNGLRVLVIENTEQPIVSMNLMIRSGAIVEPVDRAGLAQMTAGLLDKGTTTRSAQQIAEAIDSAGGSLGASAAWDSTTASTTVLSNRASIAAELLADILANPTFKDDEIERIRTQTLSGLQVNESNAGAVADEVFDKVVYGLKPYARPITGTPDSIRSITRSDIVNFHKAQYVPNNATIAIVGDIRAADAFALAEKYFGGWPKGSDFAMPRPAPSGQAVRKVIILDKPDSAQTEIRIGGPGFARSDPDYFPALVTNSILGGAPFSSRIESELRVKRGLTYGARSAWDVRKYGGAWQAETSTKTASTAESVQVILDQIAGMRTSDVSADELAQRKGFMTGTFLLSLETPSAVAGRLLAAQLYDLGPDYLDTYATKVDAVTAAEVRQIAEKRLDPNQMVIVLAGNAAEFEEKVKAFGPVEKIPFDEVDVMQADLRKAKSTAVAVSAEDAKAGMELASKTTAALGGAAYLNQKSYVAKGTAKLSAGPQTLGGTVSVWRVFPDKNRLELDLGVAQIKQYSNGVTAWAEQPGGVRDVTAETKEARLLGPEVLKRVGTDGWSVRGLPDADVNGTACRSFAISDGAGHETTFFVDATTFLPVKVAYTGKQGKVEIVSADYRDVSGVKTAYSVVQYRDGNKFIETVFTEIVSGADVDPKLFEKP
ncbi:MAG TPA: pitrilysin family protein [Blastocatellia bacterium]|nr:pitrilysin family protein [Blastocatellia bacterium]